MTTITLPRAVVEQALGALESVYGDSCDALHALRAALAQKHDPVAHSGWVLREVLFDNGEPIGHREPQHSPAALAQQAEPVAVVATQSDVWRGYNGQWAPPGEPIKMVQMLRDLPTGTPLYTAPPQRKPLTEEEIRRLRYDNGAGIELSRFSSIVRAVERAHGIGEGA